MNVYCVELDYGGVCIYVQRKSTKMRYVAVQRMSLAWGYYTFNEAKAALRSSIVKSIRKLMAVTNTPLRVTIYSRATPSSRPVVEYTRGYNLGPLELLVQKIKE